MNVLLITPFFVPQTGGVVTFVESLQRLLRKRGDRVSVLIPGESDAITRLPDRTTATAYEMYMRSLWVPGVPVKGLLAFLFYSIPTLVRLRRFLKRHAIDVICLEYPVPCMAYAYVLRAWTGTKVVVGIHGSDVLSLRRAPRHEQWLVRRMIAGADCLVAHSASLLRQAEHLFRRLPTKRLAIPYWIELGQFRALVRETAGSERRSGSPYILTVAKLHERKGLDVLLHAIHRLGARVDGHRFVIAGDGPAEDDLRRLASRLGIDDRVVFTGELQRAEIARYFADCEFFVLPSRSEPFGIVLLEAMAFGKAIVATKVGGIPEFVTDGENGVLVPPDDSAALAEHIARVLGDPELRARLGRNGQHLVEREYTDEAVIDRYYTLFREVVSVP